MVCLADSIIDIPDFFVWLTNFLDSFLEGFDNFLILAFRQNYTDMIQDIIFLYIDCSYGSSHKLLISKRVIDILFWYCQNYVQFLKMFVDSLHEDHYLCLH